MLYLLPAGAPVDLHDEFTSDGIIIFRSPTLDLIRGGDTSIDLHNGDGDIVLRVGFSRETNKIVFNTRRVETSSWERALSKLDLKGNSLAGIPQSQSAITEIGSRFS